MGHLEIAVGFVIVTDEAQAVGSHNHRRRCTYIIGCSVQWSTGGGGAGQVGTVCHLEVTIGSVVITDETQTVGPDRDCGVWADVACTVYGCAGSGGAGQV